jgi:hypothetical protein
MLKKALLLMVFALILFYLYSPYQISYSQGLPPFSYIRIKITSPLNGERIAMGNMASNAPTIYGTSIADSNYNAIHKCHVSIIVNGVVQYQPVISTGVGGLNDYSRWMYTLTPYLIREGMNTIMAKLSCINPYSTSFSTINVEGTSGLYPYQNTTAPQNNVPGGTNPQEKGVSPMNNQQNKGPIGSETALFSCNNCGGGGSSLATGNNGGSSGGGGGGNHHGSGGR